MFDPFGDYDSRGYLRNFYSEKKLAIIERVMHRSFRVNIEHSFVDLGRKEHLAYDDVLRTHKTLFDSVYPWAGQDRLHTSPEIAVSRGGILFAHPKDAQFATEHALRLGHDKQTMTEKPGEIMGYLAYGHPFLDGNGRTIMIIHASLAHRAGISIDWTRTRKDEYIAALTRELVDPGKGHLDRYLKPFKNGPVSYERLAQEVPQIKGLEGFSRDAEALQHKPDAAHVRGPSSHRSRGGRSR